MLTPQGSPEQARDKLECAIRQGGWQTASLWRELVALMREDAHYLAIRQLWAAAPEKARASSAIVRHVARAACMTGHHDEGRAMLRPVIQASGRQAAAIRFRRAYQGAKRRLSASGLSFGTSFKQKAEVALRDLKEDLNRFGVQPFLISGTLLGHIRERGFIPWDKDIDVGIFAGRDELDALETGVAAEGRFRVKRHDLRANRLALHHHLGVAIDVFPHYPEGDIVWHDGASTRWWNSPFGLKSDIFLGIEQLIPDDPERYLEENYGDWRTPQAFFDSRLDAPNVQVVDPEYLLSMHYFSLLNAVRAGNRRATARYVGLIRPTDDGPWLRGLAG